jgi:hypothetical protein
MKSRVIRIVALLVTLGLLWLGRSYWLGKARGELLALAESVKIGDPALAARRQCELRSLLKCRSAYEDDIVADTPLEFGATNWVVWLVVKQGQVTAVRFRTADSLKFKPPGSPADRGEAANVYRRYGGIN